MSESEGVPLFPLVLVLGLAAAFGLPQFADKSSAPARPAGHAAVDPQGPASADHLLAGLPPPPEETVRRVGDPPPPNRPEGQELGQISDVFRFDVTLGWITNRWPRVSSAAGEYRMQGYRVAYVSGTQLDDVAGALTYYFDEQHRCRKITFRGTSGDVRRFLAMLTALYGAEAQPSPANGVHRYLMRHADVEGEILIQPADVISSEYAGERFRIRLELARRVSPRASF